MRARRNTGFTLIELMIVVAVIAILAAIAVPSYLSQARKSRRSDAISQLGAISLQQERYRANNPTYATAFGVTGFISAPASNYYTYSISATATDYTITATASGDQTKDKASGTSCSTLAVQRDGTHSPALCFTR